MSKRIIEDRDVIITIHVDENDEDGLPIGIEARLRWQHEGEPLWIGIEAADSLAEEIQRASDEANERVIADAFLPKYDGFAEIGRRLSELESEAAELGRTIQAERATTNIDIISGGSDEDYNLDAVTASLLDDETVVEFDYRKPDGTVSRRCVRPTEIQRHGDTTYVTGEQEDGGIRMFRLDRFEGHAQVMVA